MKRKPTYDRYHRAEGRSRGTYTAHVTEKAQRKRSIRLNEQIKIILLCALIPPVGMYLLWSREDGSPARRVILSLLSFAIMFIWFVSFIPGHKPAAYDYGKRSPSAVTEYSTTEAE